MGTLTLRRSVPLLIHVLGWLLLGLALLFIPPLNVDVNWPTLFWVKQIIQFAMLIGMFYLNAQVLVPRLLFHDRTKTYVLAALGIITAFLLVLWAIDVGFNLPELIHRAFHPDGSGRPRHGRWFQPALLTALLVIGISTSVTAVQKWQSDAQLRQQLEQARTTSELSFLKAQINPHFFFNTLNNIYALTLTDVDAAREALHRLSRMMRYVLYETQNNRTLLSREIAFVQDYLQLMQLRLTDKVTVTFEQPVPLSDVPIAPMLILPFVENAFKHGVSALHESRIHIGIRQQQNQLRMEVRNTLFSDKSTSLEAGSGIGLTNTRRRLDLLYPDHYTLAVDERTDLNEYVVYLNIDLNGIQV